MAGSKWNSSDCLFSIIMYRGGAEQKIRKYLVENNYVDCIIQLPGNLFFELPLQPVLWS